MYERDEFWEEGASLLLPPQSSTIAPEVDAVYWFITLASLVLMAFVVAAMGYFMVKYRRRSHADRPAIVHENKLLEASWVVIPTILTLIVFFWGFRAYVATSIAPADSYEINVKGQKWFWTFEYPNGTITQNEIVVPAGQPVRLLMTSQDVLHSFYVPEFRIKHDVLPNRYTYVWFEAPREGVYQVVCTEYCGTGHSDMGAKIRVVGRGEFYEFLRTGGGDDSGIPLAELGEQLYTRRNCNTCHSVDGSAGTGPTWQGNWGQARPGSTEGTVNEAYVRESILNPNSYLVSGFQPQMPAYQGLLSDRQVDGLISYIKLINGAATVADTTLAPADSTAAPDGQQTPGPAATPGQGPGDPSEPMGLDAQN